MSLEEKEIEDNNSDNDSLPPNTQAPKDNNKIRAKMFFLTYARCPVSPTEWWDVIKEIKFTSTIITGLSNQEHHSDGYPHLHCILKFEQRIRSTATTFDINLEGKCYHPNIRLLRGKANSTRQVYEYIAKSGRPPVVHRGKLELFRNSHNFRKEKSDHDAWIQYRKSISSSVPCWGSYLAPDNSLIHQPLATEKKRHLWIYGAPNTRKSSYVKHMFKCRMFIAPKDAARRFDDYAGEQILWFDDCQPSFAELTSISECSSKLLPCPGNQRYYNKYFPAMQCRLIIVTTNISLDAYLQTLAEKKEITNQESEAYHARFKIYHIEQPLEFPYDPNEEIDLTNPELNGITTQEFDALMVPDAQNIHEIDNTLT